MKFKVNHHSYPLKRAFGISRETFLAADVVSVELQEDGVTGRGESCPATRYGEHIDDVCRHIESVLMQAGRNLDFAMLQATMPAGAARNAIDCALWDLRAKQRGVPAWKMAGTTEPQPVLTAYTIVLDSPQAMAQHAAEESHRPLLKVKLGKAEQDGDRISAVRAAAPTSRLIVDANEGWSFSQLKVFIPMLVDAGVELIEQPLPASDDEALRHYSSPIPLCADESCQTRQELEGLKEKYGYINIKLDKTGGLTEALCLADAAVDKGFKLMVGCMNGTSLAMAPALLVAQKCDYADLDGPLFLTKDRVPGLTIAGSVISPSSPELWG